MATYKSILIGLIEGKLGTTIDADSEENIEFLETAYYSDMGNISPLLDGYTQDSTFTANKNAWNEVLHQILVSLDGYISDTGDLAALNQTESEHYTQLSAAIQTVIKDLDGYMTGDDADFSGLINTVQEHKTAQDGVNEDIINSLDGYIVENTFQENKNAQSEINDSVISALDGYLTSPSGSSTTGVTAAQGSDGYVAFFTSANTIAGDNDLYWDRANNRLGIRKTPNDSLSVDGYISFTEGLKINDDIVFSVGENSDNVFVGLGAGTVTGFSTSYPASSVVIGKDAANTLRRLSSSVVLGTRAASATTDATSFLDDNVVIGYQALYQTTDIGGSNVVIGSLAGMSSAVSGNNVILGYFAGNGSSTIGDTVAIGYAAGQNSIASARDILIGYGAGNGVNSSSDNIYIGKDAGEDSSGAANIYIGYETGENGTGSKNICIGVMAGDGVTGNNNIIITPQYAISTPVPATAVGNANIHLGVTVGADVNKLRIGTVDGGTGHYDYDAHPLLYGDFADRYLTIHGYLNVGDGINLEGGRKPTDVDGYGSLWTADDGYLAYRDTSLNEYTPVLATRAESGTFIVTDVQTSGGLLGAGWIEIEVAGVKRYIQLATAPI